MNNDILLNRKILQWGWYKDTNTKVVFLHLLLTANWHDGEYMGTPILRGQCVFGLKSISQQTDLPIQPIRTALEHLKSTGEITIKSTNKFSVATIVKYSDYQLSSLTNNSQDNTQINNPSTNEQQTSNKRATNEQQHPIHINQVNQVIQ